MSLEDRLRRGAEEAGSLFFDEGIPAFSPRRMPGPLVGVVAVTAVIFAVGLTSFLGGSDDVPEPVATEMPESTTTIPEGTLATVRSQPIVTRIQIEQPIPLRILAVRPNVNSLVVLDLEAGTSTSYLPGVHASSGGFAGVVMTPGRDLVIWTPEGVVRLFSHGLDVADWEVETQSESIHILPTQRGEDILLVRRQGGTVPGVQSHVERLAASDGRLLEDLVVDGGPVGATDAVIVVNTERLTNDGQGWIIEPGSERVLLVMEDGSTVELTRGRAIAVSATHISWLGCPLRNPQCDLYDDNELYIDAADGSDPIVVSKPFDGVWRTVGGPVIPIESGPLQTLSPDGSQLLISVGRDFDINSQPALSALLVVDMVTSTNRVIAEFDGPPPPATWSHDGEWIALLDRNDVTLINSSDPEKRFSLAGVIPEDHFPLAAG